MEEAPDSTPTAAAKPTPLVSGRITSEEEARRRVLGERAARRYTRLRPWLGPNGLPKDFGALLSTFNPWLTLATFAIFVGVEGAVFGWPVGIGVGLVILIHECGHSYAALRKRMPVTSIILIPFVGGIASIRGRRGETAADDAYVGMMGPVFGLTTTLLCWVFYLLTGQTMFRILTENLFSIHLFNLIPIRPLDGSHLLALYLRKKGWQRDPYYRGVTDADRWRYGLLYGGLVLLCLAGFFCTK